MPANPYLQGLSALGVKVKRFFKKAISAHHLSVAVFRQMSLTRPCDSSEFGFS
jgi:hypothetical protein